ncbi:hypothetical protein F4802DRAFT_617419 [Xylaria palmicola]|nr:hypothetical protein F4802DRAFT_617419 [Xylaria palmicola]
MPSSGNDTNGKKSRRVSFSLPNSPDTSQPRPDTPQPKPALKNAGNPDPTPARTDAPSTSTAAELAEPAAAAVDPLAAIFTHTVTNTPRGLVVDGVLQPRGHSHSNIRDPPPQPQPFLNPSYIPPYPQYTGYPPDFNMSSVAAGLTPDPYAVHFQPPVPDTTYGPIQHTYVPRADQLAAQYAMPPGVAMPGAPFCAAPGMAYQQPQPGMATAPIPMMPMQAQMPMQAPMVNMQPGVMPPMACGVPAAGYMAAGMGQPVPPMTSGPVFAGAGNSSFEMGKTKAEVDAETQYNAQHNQMNEPQGMKPADDDVSRMYWCRELDGQWVPRSRFSLDRMGNYRWYITNGGVFYAKILVE